MEVFEVVENQDHKIVLKNDRQLESIYNEIKNDREVIVKWNDDDNNQCSRLLTTEGLIQKIKDGRFILESKNIINDEDEY